MEDNLHKKARLHLFRGLFILIALFAMSGRIVSQIYVGSVQVAIPPTGTAYYTYSESGGVSMLAAGTSGSYNVAVSAISNGSLDLTLKGVTVTANSVNNTGYGMATSALFIGNVAANVTLHLLGDNSLTGADNEQLSYSCGICSDIAVNLKILNEGHLTAKGGSASLSMGIYALHLLTIYNGSVIDVIGGEAVDSNSFGIAASNGLMIEGTGIVNAIGGSAEYYSEGIESNYGDIIIDTKGSVNCVGETGGYGLGSNVYNSNKRLIIKSGNVTIRGITRAVYDNAPDLSEYINADIVASVNFDGSNAEIYDPAKIVYYKYFHIDNVRDLAEASVTLSGNSFQANGSQLKPGVTATYYGMPLTEGTDYTVTYGKNVNPGQGTVTVTGKGDYTGSQTVTFTIYAKQVYVIIPKVEGVSVTPGFGLNLAGIGQPFEFTVTPDAALGKEGTDYTLEVRTDKGETLYPNGTSYKIAAVDHETTVYIIVKKLHTTGVESLSALTVYGGQGTITIDSPTNTSALVVNLTGQVVKSTKIVSGKTVFNGLSKGVYIVKVGTMTEKVMVR
jgi:hypothetical protein